MYSISFFKEKSHKFDNMRATKDILDVDMVTTTVAALLGKEGKIYGIKLACVCFIFRKK